MDYLITIDNDPRRVTAAVDTILSQTQDCFSSSKHIEIALYEAIFNALEHGNLEITFSEKEQLMESGGYEAYIEGRRKQLPYAERVVTIRYSVDESGLTVTVSDQGKGFDWRSFKKKIQSDEIPLGGNGRGIEIMFKVFDQVIYNDRGNQVKLVKKRDK